MPEYRFDRKNHLHLLDGRPLTGTTTVGDVLSKPLTWWAAELAAIECLDNGWCIPGIKAAYEAAVAQGRKSEWIKSTQTAHPEFKKARYAHNERKKAAASDGVDFHGLIELYIKARIAGESPTPAPEIARFVEWAEANVSRFVFSECHTYSEILWTGGIADFGFYDKQNEFCIGDIKRGGPYAGQYLQCGGYDIQLQESGGYTEEGKQIVAPLPIAQHYFVYPSKGRPLMIHGKDCEKARDGFKAMLNLYRAIERLNTIIGG